LVIHAFAHLFTFTVSVPELDKSRPSGLVRICFTAVIKETV